MSHVVTFNQLLQFHICQIGGATGRVGDPSGRLVERQLADFTEVDNNAASLTASIQTFFKRALLYASSRLVVNQNIAELRVVNNLDWHDSFSLLHFLHKVGTHVRINTMLNRER